LPAELSSYNELVDLRSRIDHTLLKVESGLTLADFAAAARMTVENGLRGLVVPSNMVAALTGRFPGLKLVTVVSYPLGGDTLGVKLEAVQAAAQDGASEVDAVLDLVSLVSGTDRFVHEAAEICHTARTCGLKVKLIIETPLLEEGRIRQICKMLVEMDFMAIKTSTGYARAATSEREVALLRECMGTRHLVKASGGISDLASARAMVAAGADIIGTSRTAAILSQLQSEWY